MTTTPTAPDTTAPTQPFILPSYHPTNDILTSYTQLLHTTADEQQTIMLLKQIIREPSIYMYADVLRLPAIQSLQSSTNPQAKQYYTTIYILAYGTIGQYNAAAQQGTVVELTDAEKYKLKQLTLLSILQSHSVIAYTTIQQHCLVDTIRSTEDLCIDCVYANLCVGQLDELQQQFVVYNAAARPVDSNADTSQQLDTLLSIYTRWLQQCQAVDADLTHQIRSAERTAQMDSDREVAYQNMRAMKVEEIKKSSVKTSGNVEWSSGGDTAAGPNPLSSRLKQGLNKFKAGFGS